MSGKGTTKFIKFINKENISFNIYLHFEKMFIFARFFSDYEKPVHFSGM